MSASGLEQEVLRRSSCSVEIVRAATPDGAGVAQGAMRILLATDGSEYSRAAARSVAGRPWPDGTEVKVLSVVDQFVRSIEYGPPEVIDSEERAAIKTVEEAVEITGGSGMKTAGEVATGRAKTVIVERAKEWEASLVVVGSHGRRGVGRLLLGSVSEHVANHAHCSTEVIRDRAAP